MFSVSSASLIEVLKVAEGEEPIETDQPGKEEEVCTSRVCTWVVVYGCGERERETKRERDMFYLYAVCFVSPQIAFTHSVGPRLGSFISVKSSQWNLDVLPQQEDWIELPMPLLLFRLTFVVVVACHHLRSRANCLTFPPKYCIKCSDFIATQTTELKRNQILCVCVCIYIYKNYIYIKNIYILKLYI